MQQQGDGGPIINSDGDEPTSSERRPDDPAYGLDPVVHVRLGVGHEQEGLMADWCAVLLSRATCGGRGGVEERGTRVRLTQAAASSPSRVSVKDDRERKPSEKGGKLEADGCTDAEERREVVGVRGTSPSL